MLFALFTNDNDVQLKLPYHPFSLDMGRRNEHEVLFRRIHTYLIQKGYIQKNIIDSGCWIGDNSIPWAKNLPSSTVYAIDPSDENMQFIHIVCEMNAVSNVKLFRTALSNTMEILSTDENLHHCTFTKTTEGANKAQAVSLDMLMQNGFIENVGYIHLDVEGMEAKVIDGAKALLEKYNPILTFEQHLLSDDYQGLSRTLREKGYTVYMIQEVMPGCQEDCRNFLAFPSWVPNCIVDDIHKDVQESALSSLF